MHGIKILGAIMRHALFLDKFSNRDDFCRDDGCLTRAGLEELRSNILGGWTALLVRLFLDSGCGWAIDFSIFTVGGH